MGSAVHRALELLDLRAPAEQAINFAVEMACSELGSPRLGGTVRMLVQSALRSPVIRLAGTCRHWKEVPIVADVEGRIVEGVIDLLVDTSDGLIVIDYKTDQVRSGTERDERTAAYAPQITAYAKALASTGLHVHQALLCFIGKDTVTEMQIETAQLTPCRGSKRSVMSSWIAPRTPTRRCRAASVARSPDPAVGLVGLIRAGDRSTASRR